MPTFMNFLFRVFLIAAGLRFAVSAGIAALLMVAFWGVRAAWARLTGQAVTKRSRTSFLAPIIKKLQGATARRA